MVTSLNNREITECQSFELSIGSDISDGKQKDYALIHDWKDLPERSIDSAADNIGIYSFCYREVVVCLRGIDSAIRGSRMAIDDASSEALIAAELHLYAKVGRKYITYGRNCSLGENKNDRLDGKYEVWVSKG